METDWGPENSERSVKAGVTRYLVDDVGVEFPQIALIITMLKTKWNKNRKSEEICSMSACSDLLTKLGDQACQR